jgi:hypothetical protein
MREIAFSFYKFGDGAFALGCSFLGIDLTTIILKYGLSGILTNTEAFMKLVVMLIGLIYGLIRIIHSVENHKINKMYKFEELRAIRIKNEHEELEAKLLEHKNYIFEDDALTNAKLTDINKL